MLERYPQEYLSLKVISYQFGLEIEWNEEYYQNYKADGKYVWIEYEKYIKLAIL